MLSFFVVFFLVEKCFAFSLLCSVHLQTSNFSNCAFRAPFFPATVTFLTILFTRLEMLLLASLDISPNMDSRSAKTSLWNTIHQKIVKSILHPNLKSLATVTINTWWIYVRRRRSHQYGLRVILKMCPNISPFKGLCQVNLVLKCFQWWPTKVTQKITFSEPSKSIHQPLGSFDLK